MGDGGGRHWLVRMEWRQAGRSVCLPLLIFPCTIKSRISLLAPAHPGGPGKSAVKRLWCGMVVVLCRHSISTLKTMLSHIIWVKTIKLQVFLSWAKRTLKWSYRDYKLCTEADRLLELSTSLCKTRCLVVWCSIVSVVHDEMLHTAAVEYRIHRLHVVVWIMSCDHNVVSHSVL